VYGPINKKITRSAADRLYNFYIATTVVHEQCRDKKIFVTQRSLYNQCEGRVCLLLETAGPQPGGKSDILPSEIFKNKFSC